MWKQIFCTTHDCILSYTVFIDILECLILQYVCTTSATDHVIIYKCFNWLQILQPVHCIYGSNAYTLILLLIFWCSYLIESLYHAHFRGNKWTTKTATTSTSLLTCTKHTLTATVKCYTGLTLHLILCIFWFLMHPNNNMSSASQSLSYDVLDAFLQNFPIATLSHVVTVKFECKNVQQYKQMIIIFIRQIIHLNCYV